MPDKIDQFESVFKSADKPAMVHDDIRFNRILIVSDQHPRVDDEYWKKLRDGWPVLDSDGPTWTSLPADALEDAGSFLKRVDAEGADLIVTHRFLDERSRGELRGLGSLLAALVWDAKAPAVVLPCDETGAVIQRESASGTVLAATDHLTGENQLVDYGARFTPEDGRLVLGHIEDDAIFARYMREIERIPQIETEVAREELTERLLGRPRDYIESCASVLRDAGMRFKVESVVRFGHRVRDYQSLMSEYGAELLCFHADRDDAPAMRGMAHMIATRFRNLPLFLI